uniref:Uncharacterized protein n=1 Tax=Lepeophtheirus salmonis TaxID=72036 RepID=A0A0K2U6Y1_LEPSM
MNPPIGMKMIHPRLRSKEEVVEEEAEIKLNK